MDAAGMQKLQPPLPSPKTPLPQTSSASLPPPFEFCHFIFFFLGFWCNTRILFSTRSIPPGLIVIHNLVSHDRFCPLFLLLYTHRPKHMRPIPLSFRIKAYNHMHESSCKVSMTTLKHLQQLKQYTCHHWPIWYMLQPIYIFCNHFQVSITSCTLFQITLYILISYCHKFQILRSFHKSWNNIIIIETLKHKHTAIWRATCRQQTCAGFKLVHGCCNVASSHKITPKL